MVWKYVYIHMETGLKVVFIFCCYHHCCSWQYSNCGSASSDERCVRVLVLTDSTTNRMVWLCHINAKTVYKIFMFDIWFFFHRRCIGAKIKTSTSHKPPHRWGSGPMRFKALPSRPREHVDGSSYREGNVWENGNHRTDLFCTCKYLLYFTNSVIVATDCTYTVHIRENVQYLL